MNQILSVELSHHKAPIHLREKVSLKQPHSRTLLLSLMSNCEEAFVVSTCNRTAIYIYGNSVKPLLDYFDGFAGIHDYLDVFESTEQSALHLFHTAAGLESQAIGEHQILGQIRQSYELAKETGSIGPVLDELIKRALYTGKRVRTETSIGKNSTSVSAVAYDLAVKHLGALSNKGVLLIGTGKMAELSVKIFSKEKVQELFIASHDIDRASEMAAIHNAVSISIKDIHNVLNQVSVIIGSTESEVNLFNNQDVNNQRCPRHEFGFNFPDHLLLIDLGMPRNFNPILKQIPHITLFDLDDLKKFSYNNLLAREESIPAAIEIVEEEADRFDEWMETHKVSPVISAYCENLNQIKEEELKWLLPKIGDLSEQQIELLQKFAHRLIRNVSRQPLKSIRNFALEPEMQESPLDTFRKIFNIS
jgi:glutamyl-tRNA reductase